MKNSNVTIVVPNFDPQNADMLLAVLNAVAPFNHDAWAASRVTRTLTRRSSEGDTELRVGLDLIYATNPYGEYGADEKVITLDELEQTIKDTWGEQFETYNVIGTGAGDHWDGVTAKAQEAAVSTGKVSIFDFNGITVLVSATTNLEKLARDRSDASYLGVDTVGPDCVDEYDEATAEKIRVAREARQKEWDEYAAAEEAKDAAKKKNIFDKIANVDFAVINEALWNEYKEKNTDPYGGRCVSYAEEWARLMQAELTTITKGFTWTEPAFAHAFNTIADRTSHEADYDGITGFMYGCAVNMLTQCWKHGELLRKWHNKEYGHEGDGVVNPAMMTVSVG